jgi:hypothetical protein
MKPTSLHPLDLFALSIHHSGRYRQVCRRMHRSLQPLQLWSSILLLVSATACVAPQPYQLATRDFIYLEGAGPSHLSLANSDPATYRIASKIDLSLKPDIIP